jgi:hypothetical protein
MKKLCFSMVLLIAGLILFSASPVYAQSSTSVGVSVGRGGWSVSVGHNDRGHRNDGYRNDRGRNDHGRNDRGGYRHYPRTYPPVYVPLPPVYVPAPPIYTPPINPDYGYYSHPPISVRVWVTTYNRVWTGRTWRTVEGGYYTTVTAYWNYSYGAYGYTDQYGTFRTVR